MRFTSSFVLFINRIFQELFFIFELSIPVAQKVSSREIIFDTFARGAIFSGKRILSFADS